VWTWGSAESGFVIALNILGEPSLVLGINSVRPFKERFPRTSSYAAQVRFAQWAGAPQRPTDWRFSEGRPMGEDIKPSECLASIPDRRPGEGRRRYADGLSGRWTVLRVRETVAGSMPSAMSFFSIFLGRTSAAGFWRAIWQTSCTSRRRSWSQLRCETVVCLVVEGGLPGRRS